MTAGDELVLTAAEVVEYFRTEVDSMPRRLTADERGLLFSDSDPEVIVAGLGIPCLVDL